MFHTLKCQSNEQLAVLEKFCRPRIVVCLSVSVEAVRKHDRYRRATDVDIRLKCAAFFTNARDRKDARVSARRQQLPPAGNSSDSDNHLE